MRRALPFAVVLALLAAPEVSRAQRRPFNAGGVSQLGGQILPQNRNAVAAGGLYPSIMWGQFTFGMSPTFDLGLRGDLFWDSPLSTGNFGGFGFGFGVPMRIGLSQSNKVAFALKLAPDLILGDFEDDDYYCYRDRGFTYCRGDRGFNNRFRDDDNFGFGFGFEFGLLVGIPVSIVNIVTGITSPLHFVFFEDADGVAVFIPIAPIGGAEIRLTDDLNVFGMFQFGMTIARYDYDTDADGFFRFWAGIEYAL